MPSVPGKPVIASPEAVVTVNRLLPIACRPAGFWNIASSMVPTCCGALSPATEAETMPSFEIVTETALAGIVIDGSRT